MTCAPHHSVIDLKSSDAFGAGEAPIPIIPPNIDAGCIYLSISVAPAL